MQVIRVRANEVAEANDLKPLRSALNTRALGSLCGGVMASLYRREGAPGTERWEPQSPFHRPQYSQRLIGG